MASLHHVHQVSRLLAWLCWMPIVLIIVMFSLFIAGVQPIEHVDEQTVVETDDTDGSTTTRATTSRHHFGYGPRLESGLALGFLPRLAYALLTSLPAAALLFGLFKLRTLFKMYARGELFSEATAAAMKWFALGLIGYVLLEPISDFCRVRMLIMISDGDVTTHSDYGGADLWILFLGGVFLVIAWVLGEAAKLAEDSRSIV